MLDKLYHTFSVRIFISFFFLLGFFNLSFSQRGVMAHFNEIELRIDTLVYKWSENQITQANERKLYFTYNENSPVVELRLYPNKNLNKSDSLFNIIKSSSYTLLDNAQLINDEYYKVKLRFDEISNSKLLSVEMVLMREEKPMNISIPLLPVTDTYVTVYPGESDLFIGEEKSFELVTNNQENLKFDTRWNKKEDYEYRFHRKGDDILLSIVPTKRGQITIDFTLDVYNPIKNKEELVYTLPEQSFDVNVRGSRLSFLRFDTREIVWERSNVEGVELQIDNHRSWEMNKTYRVEATDEPGGALFAELFTLRRLSNDKVLCMFRPYNFHRTKDSYLFIKDGDEPKFITNINIVPEPKIKRVSILREGGTWENTTQIYPGEKIEVRLEGESLQRGDFTFKGLNDVSPDTIVRNESVVHFLMKVPIDIREKSVSIYNGSRKTGVSLDIQEYQRPRIFDYVVFDYGGTPKVVDKVTQPILHKGTIGDVNIQFDPHYIDEPNYLYGKQFIEIEVRLKNAQNILLEQHVIDDIVVCPGEDSPRFFVYSNDGENCLNSPVSINDYLTKKTHSLENWAKIELVFRNRKGAYGGKGHSKRVEIIKQKLVTFDVDLTIPAGLLVKKVGVEGFPTLTGVSLSMLAQFSFYQRGEIQKLRPYKIGAGFLAQNAFNFNPEADRDLGIVILGSVYPSKKDRKIKFPLYAGFGYFLNEERFFYLIGPGVQINF